VFLYISRLDWFHIFSSDKESKVTDTAVTISEIVGLSTNAYNAYNVNQAGTSTPADTASFDITITSIASTLSGLLSNPEVRPFLFGLATGGHLENLGVQRDAAFF
jgi:hypothetical protein